MSAATGIEATIDPRQAAEDDGEDHPDNDPDDAAVDELPPIGRDADAPRERVGLFGRFRRTVPTD